MWSLPSVSEPRWMLLLLISCVVLLGRDPFAKLRWLEAAMKCIDQYVFKKKQGDLQGEIRSNRPIDRISQFRDRGRLLMTLEALEPGLQFLCKPENKERRKDEIVCTYSRRVSA